jgi:hypothetical protein
MKILMASIADCVGLVYPAAIGRVFVGIAKFVFISSMTWGEAGAAALVEPISGRRSRLLSFGSMAGNRFGRAHESGVGGAHLWVQAFAGLQAAAAAAVLPGRNRVRRKSIQSNRCNGTTVNYLAASERADESLVTQTVIEAALVTRQSLRGGRTWWAHVEFTRINTEPTIL